MTEIAAMLPAVVEKPDETIPDKNTTGFLATIHMPGTYDHSVLRFAYPHGQDVRHRINVLCGPNNSGKTYILREIRSMLQKSWAEFDLPVLQVPHPFLVELSQPAMRAPSVVALIGTWKYKENAGVIPLEKPVGKNPADIPAFEIQFLAFAARQVNGFLADTERVADDFWPRDPERRKPALKHFTPENQLYLARRDDLVVHSIEEGLDASLYFRITAAKRVNHPHIELVLVHGNGNAIPYSRWSDGQKAYCYLAVLLGEMKPEILLLDELENHLHPSFMTAALKLVRNVVPQTVLCTHHPHIIFSDLVDRVLFVETDRNPRTPDPERTLAYQKILHQPVPRRRIINASDDFGRIAASYRLFDHHDRQLMRQAALIESDAGACFYDALQSFFTHNAAGPSPFLTLDPQVRQFADLLASYVHRKSSGGDIDHETVTILDFGAGIGRVPKEHYKDARIDCPGGVKWICWEPHPQRREVLRRTLEYIPVHYEVPDGIDVLPSAYSDFAVMANVVHELTPRAFANALVQCADHLAPQGKLVLLEIYPLLHPEKFAMPYPAHALCNILNEIGFIAVPRASRIAEADLYMIVAELTSPLVATERIIDCIMETWTHLQHDAIRRYRARGEVINYRDYVDMLQDMSTVVSINAYIGGEWC